MDRLIALSGAAMFAAVLLWPGGDNAPEAAREPPPRVASVQAPTTPALAGNGVAEIALARAADGHFYAEAQVNGARIRALVDTGASWVVLSRADAQAAGIAFRPGEFTDAGETAGGRIALKRVTIDRLALGPIVAHRVPAVIPENDIPVSLLGQSFLERVRTVEISGDEMRLR